MFKISKVEESSFYIDQAMKSMQEYATKEREKIGERFEKSIGTFRKDLNDVNINKRKDLELQKIRFLNDRMMANVRFPHTTHNYWFSCRVCHPAIFIPKRGANDFQMKDIWEGKFCGRCHGRIAYAPKGFENCIRCHSVRREKVGF